MIWVHSNVIATQLVLLSRLLLLTVIENIHIYIYIYYFNIKYMSSFWHFKFKFRTAGFFFLVSSVSYLYLLLSTLKVLTLKDRGIDRIKISHNYSFTYPSLHIWQPQDVKPNTTTINIFYNHWERLKIVFWICFSHFSTLFNHCTVLFEYMAITCNIYIPFSSSFSFSSISNCKIDVHHQPLCRCLSSRVAV